MRSQISVYLLLSLIVGSIAASAQTSNARDTFWSAGDLISVTPNPAAHNRARTNPIPSEQKKHTPAGGTPAMGAMKQSGTSRTEQMSQLATSNGYGAPPHTVQSSADRLGLRCSVLLRGTDKGYSEVTPGTVFRSGQHIRLSLLANKPGYLYVIQQGSSGAWAPMYPPPGAAPDSSRIQAGKLQVVPGSTKVFAFDQHAGIEKLYVVLSATPIEDIDRVVRTLSNSGPTLAPKAPNPSQSTQADNVIPDALIQRLTSRDLTLVDEEKVDDASTDGGEKAIYVVSKEADRASAQVVLRLDLRHE